MNNWALKRDYCSYSKYPDTLPYLSKNLGPVVQSIVCLTCLLVVKMLTVLVSTISNSKVLLLKKNVSSFCKSHFFSTNISKYAIFENDQSFNDTLTNGIVSFEQLGPEQVPFITCDVLKTAG